MNTNKDNKKKIAYYLGWLLMITIIARIAINTYVSFVAYSLGKNIEVSMVAWKMLAGFAGDEAWIFVQTIVVLSLILYSRLEKRYKL
jgi:hypothetical protein